VPRRLVRSEKRPVGGLADAVMGAELQAGVSACAQT
jgi:hypothetical protein